MPCRHDAADATSIFVASAPHAAINLLALSTRAFRRMLGSVASPITTGIPRSLEP